MTRPHPFDLISRALAEEWFGEVEAAAREAGRDPADRLQFQRLAPVQRLLEELRPPDAEAPGAVVEEYGTLLFAVYCYRRAGQRTFALGPAELERALAAEPRTPLGGPHGLAACYLQLPERAFWARIRDDAAAEPLDGFFVIEVAGGQELLVLAVLGLRPEREGFSQIAVAAGPQEIVRAAELVRRPRFASVLAGGERAGVKSVVSEAELLHLAHLALADVGR